MSTVIKNGTIVTHDLTYKSDVLIDGSTILEIGPNLKGNNQLDASDCYIMPGGIDPHTHLECLLWVLIQVMTLKVEHGLLSLGGQPWL